MTPEEEVRQKINQLPEPAGRMVVDADQFNPAAGLGIAIHIAN